MIKITKYGHSELLSFEMITIEANLVLGFALQP